MEERLVQGAEKHAVGDLALFGGRPRFAEPLHVGRPNIGDRKAFYARLDSALDSYLLANDGPLLREFEERIANEVGVKHAVAVASATVGLQIAARAAGLRGQVIVPSFTFIATAHAIDWVGLDPVFGDIEPDRLTLDPAVLEPLIGPQTSAIVATHLWGKTADVEGLEAIASRHGLTLLFDAAHAYGCARDGRMVGGFGQAEVFSFHATKFVNAFEGGVITTNDDAFAERCRQMRNFGFSESDQTESEGTNGKMHEASAAMGLTSLDALDAIVAVNQRNLRLYSDQLSGLDGITVLEPDDRGQCNEQHVVMRLDRETSPLDRDRLQAVLRAENVLARRHFYPGCHRMAPYASRPLALPLPVTELVADEVLMLPTGTAMDPGRIGSVCELIRFAHRHAADISGRTADISGRMPVTTT